MKVGGVMTQSPADHLLSGLPMTSRRSILRGALVGASAFAVPAALAACGKSGDSGTSGSTNKTVSFGSNYSDDIPKKAIGDVMAKMQSDKGYTVKINTVDHNSFQ